MRRAQSIPLTVFTALVAAATSAHAAEYWSYTDQSIEVTAEGSPQFAVTLARDLHRLDAAMVKILPFGLGHWRPPTRIYAIPQSQVDELMSRKGEAGAFSTSGFDNDILIANGGSREMPYWVAFFGYSGSLLMSEGKLRYPYWYQVGISEVFAGSSIELKRVKIGGFLRSDAQTLNSNPLMPMRTLLRLHGTDPQLKEPSTSRLFQAECWFLVHQILIEGKHHAEFAKYLALMSEGQKEEDAFSASFNNSYEELDRFLVDALRSGRISELLIDVPDEPPAAKPQAISPAEMKARVAEYAGRQGKVLDYAMRLATESLKDDPKNEHALQAIAFVQVRQGKFAEALETVRELTSRGSLSAKSYAVIAWVHRSSAFAVAHNKATLGIDAPTLLRSARDDYAHAMELDPENLANWASLADTIGEQRDVAGAKEFFPKVEQFFYRHPLNAKLAHAIAGMCAETGDYDDAFKFAVAWQKNAMTDADRDHAGAYISHLKARAENRDPVGAAATE